MAKTIIEEPRWLVAILVIVLLAAGVYLGEVPYEGAVTIVTAILAGLGVLERRGRVRAEEHSDRERQE